MKFTGILRIVAATALLVLVGCEPPVGNETDTGGGSETPTQQVATPTITPPGGAFPGPVSVSMATTTTGATIRYTFDGSEPTSTSITYTTPFETAASGTTVIKARAFLPGFTDSSIATATFTVEPSGPVPAPQLLGDGTSLGADPYDGSVQLTADAVSVPYYVYYTLDGSEPSHTSPMLTGSVTVDRPVTVKAITSTSDGSEYSDVVSQAVSIRLTSPKVEVEANPQARVEVFSGQTVSINWAPISVGAPNGLTLAPGYLPNGLSADDITIVYTTDGTDPVTSGTATQFSGVFDVMPATPSGELKLFARRTADGYVDSEVVTVGYERYTAPVVSDPAPGAFSGASVPVPVTLSSDDASATIQYRIGGAEVWGTHYADAWVDYTGPFHLFPGGFVRLETRAVRTGWKSWEVGAKGWTVATDFLQLPGVVYRAGDDVYVLDTGGTDPAVTGFDTTPASVTFFNGMIVYIDSTGTELHVLDENADDRVLPGVDIPGGKEVFRVVGVDSSLGVRTTLLFGVETDTGAEREWLRYVPDAIDAAHSSTVPATADSVSGWEGVGANRVYLTTDQQEVYQVLSIPPNYKFPVDDSRKPVRDVVLFGKSVDMVIESELWYITSGGTVRTPGLGADDDEIVPGFDHTMAMDEISGRW